MDSKIHCGLTPVVHQGCVYRVDSTQATREGISRREKLQRQLVVGSNCSEEERLSLIDCLLSLNHIFALVDEELGETGVVTHEIDTGQAIRLLELLQGDCPIL